MPEQSEKYIQKLEAKKVQEKLKPSLKDRLTSVLYSSEIKKTWKMMPFFILHLLTCSYSDVSSIDLVKTASNSSFGPITKHLKKVRTLLNLGMELGRSFELIRNEVKYLYLRDFFQRFAQVAKLGEDLTAFLNKEFNTFMIIYTSAMERSLTRLKRLSEAYSAILSSSCVILLITIFTGIIWGGGMDLLVYMFPSLLITHLLLAYAFYIYTPIKRIISTEEVNDKIKSVMKLDKPLSIITIIANLAIVSLLTLHILPRDFGLITAALCGAPALIIGTIGQKNLNEIQAYDERFPEFISMLSISLSTVEVSITFAFRDIAKLDFGKLAPFIRRMQMRLDLGLNTNVSWKSFRKEISSELIRVHTDTFENAIRLGSPAKDIGPLISNSSLYVLSERKRIAEVSALLKGMVTPIHPILCAIMGLIMAIVSFFISIFQQYQNMNVPVMFVTMPSLPLIEAYFYTHIVTMSIINAFVVHQVEGQTEFTLLLNIGLFILSGWFAYFASLTFLSSYLQGLGASKVINPIRG
jgi:archaellum biogenesis protein FlaJ (TadC family)